GPRRPGGGHGFYRRRTSVAEKRRARLRGGRCGVLIILFRRPIFFFSSAARMKNSLRRDDSWRPMLLGLLTVLVYTPGLGIPYFADDFQFVCADPGSKILRYLYERNRFDGFYRPIQASTLAAIQTLFGWDTAPIHVVQIVMHIALVVLVYS